MEFFSVKISEIEQYFNTSAKRGTDLNNVEKSRAKYGANVLKKNKKNSFISRLLAGLCEPTLMILEFAWIITVGVNLGKFLKTGSCDIYECIGIFIAIALSVGLTMFMEGRSEKAFEMLDKTYDRISVRVIRGGKIEIIPKEEIVAGDLLIVGAGDKVVADGRIVESSGLIADESTLTGESLPVKKDHEVRLDENAPLAERVNMLYSGTFISGGEGKILVTAVGENAELGKIASELGNNIVVSAPLNEKLTRLGKAVTAAGIIAAALAFALSVVKSALKGSLDFFSVQDCFIEAIVLIVAAVPEGLPATAAVSLTLNVLKLAKSNALIRKLVAAETVGCVSVICSDKTGTLTENRMKVEKIVVAKNRSVDRIYMNSVVNSTAELKFDGDKIKFFGSATECALLVEAKKRGYDYKVLRSGGKYGKVIPFSSSYKYMSSVFDGVEYLKGAPETLIAECKGDNRGNALLLKEIEKFQSDGKRVIAFGSRKTDTSELEFDGYAVISDPVRKDVKKAVDECKKAGIRVLIMTGDNAATASAVAAELGLASNGLQTVNASELDGLSQSALARRLKNVSVIARSTPNTKLAVVESLKYGGEVVAVTGDGVNDAPAIKHADIGISMGSGSEITKEASDIVLLDDSFATIVKAVSFGRNIYRNFRRFITFQLTVNVASMLTVIVSLVLGMDNPFNAVQLLWIDIIMDGPPALTLALESGDELVMRDKPVKRTDNILNYSSFLKIVAQGVYMSLVLISQYVYDILGVGSEKILTSVFCLFVTFQLFNAFNCRKTGSESVFVDVLRNKLMVAVFAVTFAFQILLTQTLGDFFKITPLEFVEWVKIVALASTSLWLSELAKFFYRTRKNSRVGKFKLN